MCIAALRAFVCVITQTLRRPRDLTGVKPRLSCFLWRVCTLTLTLLSVSILQQLNATRQITAGLWVRLIPDLSSLTKQTLELMT